MKLPKKNIRFDLIRLDGRFKKKNAIDFDNRDAKKQNIRFLLSISFYPYP